MAKPPDAKRFVMSLPTLRPGGGGELGKAIFAFKTSSENFLAASGTAHAAGSF
jgi:hypothetical protein